jgi:hypothetical protein
MKSRRKRRVFRRGTKRRRQLRGSGLFSSKRCDPDSEENKDLKSLASKKYDEITVNDTNDLYEKYDSCCHKGFKSLFRGKLCKKWKALAHTVTTNNITKNCNPNIYNDIDLFYLQRNKNKAKTMMENCCTKKNNIFCKFWGNIYSKEVEPFVCNKDHLSETEIYNLINKPDEANKTYEICCKNEKREGEKKSEEEKKRCDLLQDINNAARKKLEENFKFTEIQKTNEIDDKIDFTFKDPGVKIGDISANGVVIVVPITRNFKKTLAILKVPKTDKSDNMVYEYFVGKYFINQFVRFLPCFMETYALYEISQENRKNLIENIETSKDLDLDLKDKIFKKVNTNYSETEFVNNFACDSKIFCPLIQYFQNFTTIDSFLKKLTLPENYEQLSCEITTVLYQVFFGLEQLKGIFVHNDLHPGNIGYYQPFKSKYIKFNYHIDNIDFIFYSPFVAKIIDYGRVFVSAAGSLDFHTKKYIQHIRDNCKPYGPNNSLQMVFYTSQSAQNQPNTDILLLMENLLFSYEKEISNFFEKILPKTNNNGDKIPTNVTTKRTQLQQFLLDNSIKIKGYYEKLGFTEAGTLHVFDNITKAYDFIPAI